MRISSRFQALNTNDARLAVDLDKILESLIREAAKVWVRAALHIVPIWSTASHYTFQDLAQQAGIGVNASPAPGAPDRKSLGLRSGFGAIDKEGDTWFFDYETDLDYLINNELGITDSVTPRLKTSIPYDFREKANEITLEFIERKLEQVLPLILSRAITVRSING